MKKIRIIEIKSELGAGTRGASMGVDALKVAAWDDRSHYFKQYPSTEVPHENELLFEPAGNPYAKRIKGIVRVHELLSEEVKQTIARGEFPIVLSGDHSSAAGTIAGVKKAYPKDDIGVIWIDAHADLHTPYTTPSGNVHGMPLAAALGEDNMRERVNNPDKETADYWEKMKAVGGAKPNIKYENLVFIGLRDLEKQEEAIIRRNKVKVISVAEVKKFGPEKMAKEALSYLRNCKYIYISFDVDSLDPKISRGTGTPAPNGFTEKEVRNLILELVQNPRLACFEITEINPTLDRENMIAEVAFEILQRVTNQLEQN